MGFVSPENISRCPCCQLQVPETVAHLLVSCPRWTEQRQVFDTFIYLRDMDEASAGNAHGGDQREMGIEDRLFTTVNRSL